MSESDLIGGTSGYEYDGTNFIEIGRADQEPLFERSQGTDSKSFTERISRTDRGIHTYFIVDRVIRVKILSDAIIKQKINFWEERRAVSRNQAYTAFCVPVVTGGVFSGIVHPLWIILAIGGLYRFRSCLIRMNEASNEIDSWKRSWEQDPAGAIAKRRSEALTEGLIFVYKKDAEETDPLQQYRQILSDHELQKLYHQYFHRFRDRLVAAHDCKSRLELLIEVLHYSPLASPIYRYARIPEHEIHRMEAIRSRYDNFLKICNSIASVKEMKRIETTFKERIRTVEGEAEKRLKSIDDRYADEKKKLATGFESAEYYRQAEARFPERYKAVETVYENEREGVLKERDKKLREIETEKGESLARIYADQSSRLLPLYLHATTLHREAYKLSNGKPIDTESLATLAALAP
ncbi:MAG: hypothetical protein AAGE99_01225 [Chlamydiota bacterium]